MNPLVTPTWLRGRLGDTNIIVLDATLPPVGVTPKVDTRGRYVAEHIPGAIFFDIEEHSDHSSPLPHMLPSPEEFSRAMGPLGVSEAMDIVIYEQQGVFSAPRARWMLRAMGARKVALLDGGLRAWVEAGLPVEAGEVVPSPTTFRAEFHASAVKNFADIQRTIADGGQILDARSGGRFSGTSPEPRPGLSSGHMPGAVSVPFTEIAEEGQFKTPEQLRDLFAAKQVNLHRPIVTTCGSGVTAAVVALGLELAGAEEVGLYDGSWAEYAQHPDAVIRKSR